MDGRAQSGYEHCTASGLQCPRVNLTYRWVAQRAASRPPAGVVGCVLPSSVQRLAERGSRGLGMGIINGRLFGRSVLLLLILVSVLLVSTWIHIRRGIVTVVSVHPARRCASPPGVVPVGLGTALATVTTSPIFQRRAFFLLLVLSRRGTMLF